MKEYECVQVDHHNLVAEKIKEYLGNGWLLHTYQAVGHQDTRASTHYLLFEKG